MRKIVATFLFVMAGMAAYAAQPGAICTTARPIGEDFREEISGPSVVWYKAWTFDLPLTVYFAPKNESDPAPEVEMDFTCTPGVYTDSILCSLFCKNGGSSGIDFGLPHKPTLQTDRLPDGTFVYYLSLGKKYRDLLLQMGISDNLAVFVKVTYKAAGVISIAPNDLFANCMDGHKFIQLGDTVRVKTRDKSRHVIVPYVQWQEDSIRYVWDGSQPVTIAISYACDIDPTDNGDERILDFYTLQPKDTLKLTSPELKYYVKEADSEAGMFYAKFYSEGTGTMKIERVPQAPPKGGATLLRYDRTTQVDTAKLYAIPYTWTTATRFDVPTDHIFRMYVGTVHDFKKTEAIATYQFSRSNAGHWLGLVADDMQALWAQAVGQYLYIRFECTAKTSITPTIWRPSDCVVGSTLLEKNKTYTINSKSTTIYRIYYPDWQGGDMSVAWNQNAECKWLISGDCEISTNQNAASVIDYTIMQSKTTYTKAASRIANRWEPNVDPDGFIYMRFYTTKSGGGQITVTTTAPDEEDPAPITYPAATISVLCDGEPTADGQAYIVRVSVEQDLSLYPGDPADMGSRTPLETWHQTAGTTHALVLESGVYTLKGIDETIRVVVK